MEIEIWDLDVVDLVEFVNVLGGILVGKEILEKKKKLKKKFKVKVKEVKYKEGSYIDVVLSFLWNLEFWNVIVSVSVDKLIKIWDIVKGICEYIMNIYIDKV